MKSDGKQTSKYKTINQDYVGSVRHILQQMNSENEPLMSVLHIWQAASVAVYLPSLIQHNGLA